MNKPVATLLQTEMTRKEFLATLALGMASVMGLSTIIHLLTGKSLGGQLQQKVGYGSSAYGGGKDQ
ncbi:MAG TPA: hypothetical protein VG604_03765 [Candidatus Saccharimonadales bacterium]|nr:hypothetical protein [Candidatus Saccharimonadales bacterium]